MRRGKQMDEIRAMLAAGTRMAKGRVGEAVELVRAEPRKIARLVECLWDDDAGVANRAADALERVTRGDAKLLARWKEPLIGLMAEAAENKLRWNLALTVPRMSLTAAGCRVPACGAGARKLSRRQKLDCTDGCAARTGGAGRAGCGPAARCSRLLRVAERTGTAAMRARSRILLRRFEKPSPHRAKKKQPA
jgi:hypothetical protein